MKQIKYVNTDFIAVLNQFQSVVCTDYYNITSVAQFKTVTPGPFVSIRQFPMAHKTCNLNDQTEARV